MAGISAERALRIWQEQGEISAEQAAGLRDCLSEHAEADRTARGIVIFSTIGAVLVGVGIILFVGSNWERFGPVARGSLVFGAYLGTCALASLAGRRGYARVQESLWLLATIAFGGAIFLLAQIFNFSLTFWQGPFLWLVGTLAMGYARQRGAYGLLAVPLAVLALGWLGGGSGWFMDDQLEFLWSERGLTALLGPIGLGWVSLGLLARRSDAWSFIAPSFIVLGSLLLAGALVLSTTFDEAPGVMFRLVFTTKQIAIIAVLAVLVGLASVAGDASREARITLAGLLVLSLAMLVPSGGRPLLGELVMQNLALFAAYVVLVFVLFLVCVWIGVRSVNRALVNLGIVASTAIILIQYFAWSFEMLPTSFAFILGGAVLIGVSLAMERTRRAMLARMAAG